MSEEDSCYSNDEEYFLDVCRAGEMEELVEFVKSLPSDSTFNWAWFNNQNDNFMRNPVSIQTCSQPITSIRSSTSWYPSCKSDAHPSSYWKL